MTKDTLSLSSVLYVAVILSVEVTAFKPPRLQHRSSFYHPSSNSVSHCFPMSALYSKFFGPDEDFYDDGIGDLTNGLFDNSGDDEGGSYGGNDLARDFYKQLRQRGADSADTSTLEDTEDTTLFRNRPGRNNDDAPNDVSPVESSKSSQRIPSSTTLPEDEARYRNQQPFSKRKETSVASSGRSNGPPSQGGVRKYTGQSESGLGRPSSKDRSNDGSVRPGRSSRQAMMEREFELAGRGSGGNLGLQAAVTVVALIFYIYVGLSGGIVTGQDAANVDFGGDDMIPFEQVIPVPRDSEPSIWI